MARYELRTPEEVEAVAPMLLFRNGRMLAKNLAALLRRCAESGAPRPYRLYIDMGERATLVCVRGGGYSKSGIYG